MGYVRLHVIYLRKLKTALLVDRLIGSMHGAADTSKGKGKGCV